MARLLVRRSYHSVEHGFSKTCAGTRARDCRGERSALAWNETVTRCAESGVPDAGYEAAAAEFSAARAGTAILGMAVLDDSAAQTRILCIAFILAGVVGLRLVPTS